VLTAIFASALSPFRSDADQFRSVAGETRHGALAGRGISWAATWFSRIVGGSQISLAVGLGSIVLGSLVGVPIGLLSGYFGGCSI